MVTGLQYHLLRAFTHVTTYAVFGYVGWQAGCWYYNKYLYTEQDRQQDRVRRAWEERLWAKLYDENNVRTRAELYDKMNVRTEESNAESKRMLTTATTE